MDEHIIYRIYGYVEGYIQIYGGKYHVYDIWRKISFIRYLEGHIIYRILGGKYQLFYIWRKMSYIEYMKEDMMHQVYGG